MALVGWAEIVVAGANSGDDAPRPRTVWRRPSLGGAGFWETIAEDRGYRVQRHRVTRHYRLADSGHVTIRSGPLLWVFEGYMKELRAEQTEQPRVNLNLPMPTLGGLWHWEDTYIYGGWRVQRNILTGHFRLLDRKYVRHAWGSREQCEWGLREKIEAGKATLTSDTLVVMVHGVGNFKDSMLVYRRELQKAGFEVYGLTYPSCRRGIETHARQLRSLLETIDSDFREIHFVTHSMGGLVTRLALRDWAGENLGRVVMVTPPSQGSEMADKFHRFPPARWMLGPAVPEMRTAPEALTAQIPPPPCEFGIIGAGRFHRWGVNPIFGKDNDGMVSVENMKLEGMNDWIVYKSQHSMILTNREAARQAVHFLLNGRFDHDRVPEKTRKKYIDAALVSK